MAFDYRTEYHRYKQYYFKLQSLSGQPIARASFTLVASLLTAAFFGIFAIKPTLGTIARLTKEIEDRQKVEKQLETKLKALKQIESAYEAIKPQLPLIDAALPKTPEFERLEREIEFLAWEHGVILSSGSFSGFPLVERSSDENQKDKDSDSDIPAKVININLTVAGDYSNLKQFITGLETLDRVILVKSLNFSEKTKLKGAKLQISLNSQAFYKPQAINKP